MKRALAVCAAIGLFGFMGLGQISGKWEASIDLLPDPGLDFTTLTLSYTIAGLDISSVSTFDADGFTDQSFELAGTVGPVVIEGSMAFSPMDEYLKHITHTVGDGDQAVVYELAWLVDGPAYKSTELDLSATFAGIDLGLAITHEVNYVAIFGLDDFDWGTQTPSTPIGSWCYDKYLTVYEEVETDVEVTVSYWVDPDDSLAPPEPEFTGDEVLLGTYTGVFEYDVTTGDLTDEALEWLTRYGHEKFPEPEWDYYTYTIDPDDVVVRFWLPDYMTYTFTAGVDPFSLELVFDDVSTGIQFSSALLTLEGMSLCCGVTFDAELSFTKCEGFEYLKFSAANLFPICCGISFDMGLEFTTGGKAITIEPKWEGVLDGCFEIYGDVQEKPEGEFGVDGIEIYGFKLRCDLAECHYVEFLTALNVAAVEELLDEDIFEGDEFEYVKLGFCGPGCCGGEYSVGIAVYFEPTGLFGISRLGADFSIPVMSGFTVDASFSSEPSLSLGWTFTF